MILNNKFEIRAAEQKDVVRALLENLNRIYSNKSCDEYKIKGDITKSPCYESMEVNLANMSSIKGYPKEDLKSLKTLFNVLHRPRFAKMVKEHLVKATEATTIFTSYFTLGYRLLVIEISRVVASTKISNTGFKYDPDKISRKESCSRLIRYFNNDVEERIDAIIKRRNHKLITLQESAVTDIANIGVSMIESVFSVFNNIFHSAASLNPISLMSAILSRSYDKKVEKFEKISKEYEMAKKAYDEWQQIPVTNRKERVGHRYVKMIDRYNIKMEKIKKELEHYDMRSKEEVQENVKRISSQSKQTSTSNTSQSSSSDNNANSNGFVF